MSRSPTSIAIHRRIVQVGSFCLVVTACGIICAPMVLPPYPFIPRFLGNEVPLGSQRALVVAMGSAYLLEGVFLLSLSKPAWWYAMALGTLGALDLILSSPSFIFVLIQLAVLTYLYSIRDIFAKLEK